MIRFKDFIRTKDQNAKGLDLENDTEVLSAIINYPKIIERPIIVHKEKAIIARPAELLYDFLYIYSQSSVARVCTAPAGPSGGAASPEGLRASRASGTFVGRGE